ncbi:MAG TPA: zf-HC2 domain-containing protein [Thermoleophilaceae bacterium]|nr:zf-HC2 domain-containing protein [Thermoleophilaceae bacterium]
MEHATLRPVPLRLAGPVDPAEALAHVSAALPDLSADAARALALIEIAGRTRDAALEEMQLSADVLADLLYQARKALRRSVFPLSASGWCERAERLLSDRIDGVLAPPGPARLAVHLRNCERCVDHERRLSQARENLVRGFTEAHPHTNGAGPAERPVATLRVVEPVAVAPAYDGPTHTIASFAGVAVERGEADLPRVSFAGPGGQVEIRVETPRVEAPSLEAPRVEAPPVEAPRVEAPRAPEPDELPEDPPFDDDIPPAEPADTSPSEHDAEDEDPPVEEDTQGVSLVWGTLSALSVGLAIFALVVTVLALAGLQRLV